MLAAALVVPGLMAGAAHAASQTGGLVTKGGYLSASFPTGDWGDVAGFGLGLENATVVYPDSSNAFGLRSGGSLIYNFGKTVDVPSSSLGPNTTLAIDTHNTSLWLGIGPEFAKHTGNARPFVYGTIGVTFNWIDSHLQGNVQGVNYDATVGQTSTTFTYTVGGGISKPAAGVPGGRLELSAEYRNNNDQDYLLPSSVSSSGSTVSWSRTSQNASQIIVRIGIVSD
jgi:hypothetical protein